MTYQRLAYDDASTADQMTSDCAAVDLALHLAAQRPAGPKAPPVGATPDTLVVSDDLAALAAGLELHFD